MDVAPGQARLYRLTYLFLQLCKREVNGELVVELLGFEIATNGSFTAGRKIWEIREYQKYLAKCEFGIERKVRKPAGKGDADDGNWQNSTFPGQPGSWTRKGERTGRASGTPRETQRRGQGQSKERERRSDWNPFRNCKPPQDHPPGRPTPRSCTGSVLVFSPLPLGKATRSRLEYWYRAKVLSLNRDNALFSRVTSSPPPSLSLSFFSLLSLLLICLFSFSFYLSILFFFFLIFFFLFTFLV